MVKKAIKKFLTASGSKKRTSGRAAGTKRLLAAFGAGRSTGGGGAGRPKGSYKYRIGGKPVSVFEYRKFVRERKQQLNQFQRQQGQRLQSRGFSPEQTRALQQRQIIERAGRGQRLLEDSPADEQVAFEEYLAKNTVSPNTRNMLIKLRQTQLKGKMDDIQQQRRIKEKAMVAEAGSLLATPFIFKDHQLDVTGVDSSSNILMAPNAFKETQDNPNILQTNKLNIMQTREAGNSLDFF